MSLLDRYQALFEYEKDCNHKMLAMLDSVPEIHRSDARYNQAMTLAGHLAAGREKWLDYMKGNGPNQIAWWDDQCDLASLAPRFAALEDQWTGYLTHLTQEQLARDFEFIESNGKRFLIPIEVQIEQLVGHAAYHRGQVALLVSQLGGEVVDTDYTDWWWSKKR